MRAAIALALVTSLTASAECKKDDFNRYIAAAQRLYEGLEYERAIDQLNKAKEVSCGVHDDAQLRMYEGIVRSDLGDGEKARAAFKEALLLEPDAEIPLKVSPKMRKQIEALRAEAKKELAPILARQEEERRKRLAEDAERERQRREEEARRAQENARTEEQRQKAAAELERLEQQRRDAEAARRLEQQRKTGDAPKNRQLTATTPDTHGDVTAPPTEVTVAPKRGLPVTPIVFGAFGLVAGGVSVYFGLSARQLGISALNLTSDQPERQRIMNDANTNAIVADILFGVAGLAAVVALITLIAGASEK